MYPNKHPFYKDNGRKVKARHLIAVVLGVEGEYIRFRIIAGSRDLAISREYGWLARQRCAAVTRPVEMQAGQSRGQDVPQP